MQTTTKISEPAPPMSKKRRRWVLGAAAAVVLLLGGYGAIGYSVAVENTEIYILAQGTPTYTELIEAYGQLSAVGIRGMPGFAAALGKVGASESATKLLRNEKELYAALTDPWYFAFVDAGLKECVSSLHRRKVARIEDLQRLAGPGFIQIRHLEEAMNKVDQNGQPECLEKYNRQYPKGTRAAISTSRPQAELPVQSSVSEKPNLTGVQGQVESTPLTKEEEEIQKVGAAFMNSMIQAEREQKERDSKQPAKSEEQRKVEVENAIASMNRDFCRRNKQPDNCAD